MLDARKIKQTIVFLKRAAPHVLVDHHAFVASYLFSEEIREKSCTLLCWLCRPNHDLFNTCVVAHLFPGALCFIFVLMFSTLIPGIVIVRLRALDLTRDLPGLSSYKQGQT